MSANNAVTPQAVKAMLRDGNELALVDVRDQGTYFHEHLLFAGCIPLGHLELRIADLVPRASTRIVLCDADDEGHARDAAKQFTELGYSDVSVMSGGVSAWRNAGFEVFAGINVVSKAFGEYIEHRYDTPRISAQALAQKSESAENMIILDSRPMEEFHKISIPGGINCPGAELVYRVFDAAPDPATLVVVNCAGRTRSIIGAQSLINAGIPNAVVALKDGTMGWQLAGYKPASGETTHVGEPTAAGHENAKAVAARVAEKFGVSTIGHAQLAQWRSEEKRRTLYLLDVRTPEEYIEGHLPGSLPTPGGQLVQATDEYVATRHARIVLVDNDGVRATMTASWLRQMGWTDVYVLENALNQPLDKGLFNPTLLGQSDVAALSAQNLKQSMDRGEDLLVLDFANSLQYRRQHIPGALWAMRTRLDEALSGVSINAQLILTSPDGALAQYAANDLNRDYPERSVQALRGGMRSWLDKEYPTATGPENLTTEPNDIWYKPYEQASSVRDAMQGYLDWEVNLVAQIERDGDAHFL